MDDFRRELDSGTTHPNGRRNARCRLDLRSSANRTRSRMLVIKGMSVAQLAYRDSDGELFAFCFRRNMMGSEMADFHGGSGFSVARVWLS